MKWFVDEFYSDMKSEWQKKGESVYKYLDDLASLVPEGSGGLISIDDLQGRFFPPHPNVRGLFIGHTWAHKGIDFYRAILESIAYDYMLGIEILREIEPDINIEKIVAIGSGANSDVWLQIKADCLQIPFETLIRTNLSSLGAAVVGGLAVGIFKDVDSFLKRVLKVKKRIDPYPQSEQKYRKYYNLYKDLVAGVNEYFDRIV